MGQAGLYQAIAMYVVAYIIICMTVLSVCAISTNGALDAGGAYCILLKHTHTHTETPSAYDCNSASGAGTKITKTS